MSTQSLDQADSLRQNQLLSQSAQLVPKGFTMMSLYVATLGSGLNSLLKGYIHLQEVEMSA